MKFLFNCVPHNTGSTLITKALKKCDKVSGLKRVMGKNYFNFVDAKFEQFDRFYTEEYAVEDFRNPEQHGVRRTLNINYDYVLKYPDGIRLIACVD